MPGGSGVEVDQLELAEELGVGEQRDRGDPAVGHGEVEDHPQGSSHRPDRPGDPCSTKATRSAGASISRTTSMARPTESACTTSCWGPPRRRGSRAAPARAPRPAPRAGSYASGACPGRYETTVVSHPPRFAICGRRTGAAAARPPGQHRRPRGASRACGRPPTAGGCGSPRSAWPGDRGPPHAPPSVGFPHTSDEQSRADVTPPPAGT